MFSFFKKFFECFPIISQRKSSCRLFQYDFFWDTFFGYSLWLYFHMSSKYKESHKAYDMYFRALLAVVNLHITCRALRTANFEYFKCNQNHLSSIENQIDERLRGLQAKCFMKRARYFQALYFNQMRMRNPINFFFTKLW